MSHSAIYRSFQIPKSEWQRIGEEMVTSIVVRSGAGVDRDGRAFPAYSEKYAEKKATGFLIEEEAPIGVKAKRPKSKPGKLKGVSTSRRVATPDFRLTGDTLNSTRVLASDDKGFIVGWTGDAASKVSGNEERGKYKIAGFSPHELRRITDEIDQVLNRLWNSEPRQIDL